MTNQGIVSYWSKRSACTSAYEVAIKLGFIFSSLLFSLLLFRHLLNFQEVVIVGQRNCAWAPKSQK